MRCRLRYAEAGRQGPPGAAADEHVDDRGEQRLIRGSGVREEGVVRGARVAGGHEIVLDITGADESTLHAAAEQLGRRWAASGAPRVRWVSGEPGVKARLYAGLRH
ncbi:DUF6207 family protein [Streptomyces globisporus]|uniref:DUF6207 family protein n=1 Tax=Streptomyces globisporus TaxID=1908 RepID=UPI001F33E17F|nr:DUF6207 family protein [Streptomyces globisporus]